MKTFLERLLTLETLVAGTLYALAASILFIDVASRELFASPVWGGQRMAILMANGAALIGISVAVALNLHIRPVVLDKIIPQSWVAAVEALGNGLAGIVMFVGAYYATMLVLDNRSMGFTATPLDLQVWIPQCFLVYGLLSAGLRYLIFAFYPDCRPAQSEPEHV